MKLVKIVRIIDCLKKKKVKTYKKCSFRKDSSLSELKLGRRLSPSGFTPRSKRKRYLTSYSLNNLQEKELRQNLYMGKIIKCLKRLDYVFIEIYNKTNNTY